MIILECDAERTRYIDVADALATGIYLSIRCIVAIYPCLYHHHIGYSNASYTLALLVLHIQKTVYLMLSYSLLVSSNLYRILGNLWFWVL